MSKNETACIDDSIYCKLPEPLDGYGGYKPDILVDNLTEREINLFLCNICHGIKIETCFQEHENRPDLLVNTRGIRQEIGNLRVCCPLYQCKWEGKISEFHTPIHNCAARNATSDVKSTIKMKFLFYFFFIWICCLPFLLSVGCLMLFFKLNWIASDVIYQGELLSTLYSNFETHDRHTHPSLLAKIGFIEQSQQTSNFNSRLLQGISNDLMFQGMRLAYVEQELASIQNKIIEFGKSIKKSKDYSKLIANFNQSFSNLLESNQIIRHNPYMPQKGVIWNIYQVNEILEKPTEDSGPEFYINEYKFQPSIETLRDNEACITFCISLVNCNHYDKIKWPMGLEDKAFRVFLQTQKNSSETLYFEVNEDNKFYFDKPRNEKNKPLCRQWICKKELNKYVENDGLIVYVRNTEVNDST